MLFRSNPVMNDSTDSDSNENIRKYFFKCSHNLLSGINQTIFYFQIRGIKVTAALVLMAISFVFGPLRSVTLGQRVFTGVVVGFVFRIAQDLLGPASLVFGFAPIVAVVLPALICAGFGFWLLRRAG